MEKMNLWVIIWNMENEQRKFFRHPIKIPIQLTRVENKTSVNSRAEDLSQGGLTFFWPESIPKGTHLELSIPVEKQLFKIKGHVAHSEKDAPTGLFKTGVCFENSISAFRAKLAEEILRIREFCEKLSLLRGRQLSEEEAAQLWVDRHAEDFAQAMNLLS